MSARASAFRLLEQYFEADMLTLDQLQFHKEKYAKLHSCVLATYKHEKQLLKEAKALNRDLLGEKIQVEKQAIRKAEEVAAFSSVEREKDRALKELAEAVDRDAVLAFEITELQREYADLVAEKEAILAAHAQLIEPEVKQLTIEIAGLAEETHRLDSELSKDTQRKKEYLARLDFLHQENTRLEQTSAAELKRLHHLQGDPDRMQKQADVVARAVAALDKESNKDKARAGELQAAADSTAAKLRDADEVHRELAQKLDVHRETIDQRQRDVDHVTLHLREEQNVNVMRLGEKTRLDIRAKALELATRRENERCTKAQKDYDRLKRELKKQILQLDSSKALLPNLRAQVVDVQHQISSLRSENKDQAQRQLDVKQQVDLLIARFLKQEDGDKLQSEELEALSAQVAELEAEVAQWLVEESKQKKLVTMLTAQRELKAREATSALNSERQTQQELKTKELVIFDLAKKWNETTNHLREFSALYDVVKNERNKYVNLIQASTQALAEMKEKIKILNNEVEVLRNESLAKDKALVKEKLAHSTAQCSRDSLRLDTNKSHDAYRTKQEQVEQQIVEIDKLNGIITHTEKELLRLKKKYELAVDARNGTGVQLIDRNDELCILYEKSNLQEQALNSGETGLSRKDQEIRVLKIELADLQRQLENARRQLPHLPELAQRILLLQEDLKQEKDVTELLCRDLETPKNSDRWRSLGGEDPDEDQLTAKLAYLEDRYHHKKEKLLEKELVLEEVTGLSNKLRTQASARRGETLELAKRVNDFQGRIKETTRRMMAVVSELSMYQATAMKLQQEKHDAFVDVEDCQKRALAGYAPNAYSEQQLVRLQAQKLHNNETRAAKEMAKAAAAHAANFPSQFTYTTAEARPNAYIPDDLGIPKPYGQQAPFKPTEQGTTMRHIRVPQKRDIEI
ncbi:MBO2, coiled coil flagellar protein [Phytophthora infestans T30-4]|uniref:MBO2, coiled coil flagellar protein n=1 Tax=Phytophthora infestans (strain T30-4) TaxID=403677 RepID=D0MVU9_PHYIT|nr:MBO2, coiled coil flagellar protein [Phytophthora infestans T30-4]EEY63762.1 MBO2, coiled coil flagellar protein [Phytophthora infestans T30-4]|eukprot:XP_002907198.1 MBO2, coiled coil flagellar protein [Phytophthora infestans T30-4]